jgi:unsaturated chondroitin disaccharide hydrolase
MEKILRENKQWIDETWAKIEKKLSAVSELSKNKIPSTSIDGVHNDLTESPGAWTNGFWPGMM